MSDRSADLIRFYEILDHLETRLGGPRLLAQCHGRQGWPRRGVYFFFEPCELRSAAGPQQRVVRVGTHALQARSKTSLWRRLSQHRGTKSGGGHHRGSIFRHLVGEAFRERGGHANAASWGVGSDPGKAAQRLGISREDVAQNEHPLEQSVSRHIGGMPFLWIAIDDEPGAESHRGLIERNSIALLSNYRKAALDPASDDWLGRTSGHEKVRLSGLWNNNHVDEPHDPTFLPLLEQYVYATEALAQ